jgi:hypothetical protein
MNWLDDMKADALALASPGFALEPGDRIEVSMDASPGGHLSSVTFEPGYLRIAVAVWRPTDTGIGDPGWDGPLRFREIVTGRTYYHAFYRAYVDEEAPQFFLALMQQGQLSRESRHAAQNVDVSAGAPASGE